MQPFKYKLTYLALAAALTATACGGSNDSDTTAASDTVTGVITGFGSVFVDGVEYETDNASFSLDGSAGSEDDLAVGMVVTLKGSVNADGKTGHASSISYDDDVEGRVLANNYLLDGTLDVMGQTVHITADTMLESKLAEVTGFEQIAVNNIVEVSGFSSGTGEIYATHVEVKKAKMETGDSIEVKGVIANHDSAAMTFTLGTLTVDYSNAILEDFSSIENGLYVEVKSHQDLRDGVMLASKIELENDGYKDERGDYDDEREFEGIIMSLNADESSIVVNGQTVYYNQRTEFEYGTMADLAEGLRIKVEARFNNEGELVAEEIKFRKRAAFELEGSLEAVDRDANTVTLMGQTFLINNSTMLRDEQDDHDQTPIRYFNVADLSVGDWVEIRAYRDQQSGDCIATKLERDDHELGQRFEISGLIEDNSVADQFTVAGITVDYSAIGSFTAQVGQEIEVEGGYANGIFSATEIEIED